MVALRDYRTTINKKDRERSPRSRTIAKDRAARSVSREFSVLFSFLLNGLTRVLTRDLKVVGREIEVFPPTLMHHRAVRVSRKQYGGRREGYRKNKEKGKGGEDLGLVSWHGQRACCHGIDIQATHIPS